MRRSEINSIMRVADTFIRERGFYLPPFAYWSPADWQTKGPEVAEIVENQLGWDITDFGRGDFNKYGLFMFTVRNGHPRNYQTGHGKLYCEKILIVDEDQITPYHFHWSKMEDIINRGGGQLMVRVYLSSPTEQLDQTREVVISIDGVQHTIPPGGLVVLEPGESITLEPNCYHEFWAEGGKVLVGEVSLVNDDFTDNRFLDAPGRFPAIEEDEPPLYLLYTDYPKFYHPAG
jgi:D-lyxose ketol-isomerase